MKRIIFETERGLAILVPAEGARLARSVTLGGNTTVFDVPTSVDHFARVWPVVGAVVEWAETEDEFVDRIAAEDVPKGVTFHLVDPSSLPSDRSFRGAWVSEGKGIVVDMPKAREIHRDHLRNARAPLLAALDVEYQRADETGDTAEKKRVADKKKALRDVTADPAIDGAKTPEELAAAVPAILKA